VNCYNSLDVWLRFRGPNQADNVHKKMSVTFGPWSFGRWCSDGTLCATSRVASIQNPCRHSSVQGSQLWSRVFLITVHCDDLQYWPCREVCVFAQNHPVGDIVAETCPYMCIEQSPPAISPRTNYVMIRRAVTIEHHCRGDRRAFKLSVVPNGYCKT
jgi:hypothetical protein